MMNDAFLDFFSNVPIGGTRVLRYHARHALCLYNIPGWHWARRNTCVFGVFIFFSRPLRGRNASMAGFHEASSMDMGYRKNESKLAAIIMDGI